MYIILFMLYYYSMRKMDEHTCYILSLRLTFLQTVNVTSNILLEYSIKWLIISFLVYIKKDVQIYSIILIINHTK